MNNRITRFATVAALCAGLAVMTGCTAAKDLFGEREEPPLEGKRLTVLEFQNTLEPDPVLANSPLELPASWNNKFWPQSGGYPSHAMGHLKLSATLERAWSADVGDGGGVTEPLIAQPVVADTLVFTMDVDGDVTAFDTSDGDRVWRVSVVPDWADDDDAMGGGLAFSRGRLFVTAGFRELVALAPDSGEVVWRQKTLAPLRAAPTVLDERVYAMTLDNKLLAFSAEDGTPLWTYEGLSETTNLLGAASPAADRNVVVVAFSSGELFALRAENGQVLWSDNLASVRRPGSMTDIADIRGMPVIDKGLVYAISFAGRMVAIDEISGARVWQREIGGAETPWAVGDSVFVLTGDQQLVALDRGTGNIRWVRGLPNFENPEDREDPIVWTGPVLAGQRLILAGNNGKVIELDPASGDPVNRWKASGSMQIPPVVAGGTLYLLGSNGKLEAWR